MENKIKISLPKNTLNILKKDCADFLIVKTDGSNNMNSFINRLIINFYREFSASEESLHEKIQFALKYIPQKLQQSTSDDVIKIITNINNIENPNAKKETVTFSFKPTVMSKKAVAYIENIILKNESISSFYRRMFMQYTQKPQTEREKIIFRENYKLLEKAIKKQLVVCITMKNGLVYKNLSVYQICPAIDELFNYTLCTDDRKQYNFRIAKLDIVTITTIPSTIPDEIKTLFDKQIKCGAQYPIYQSNDENVVIKLSEKGIDLFKKIYLYRPIPIKIEKNIYTFDCSYFQISHYFKRFGSEAVILSPKYLGKKMRDFYFYALKEYRKTYKEK